MQCAAFTWRPHLNAMSRLIKLRGGLENMWHEAAPLRAALITFLMCVTPRHLQIPFNSALDLLN